MTFEPIPLDPRVLISGQKSVAGFWLSDWAREQGALGMLRLFRQVQSLMRRGVLTTEIAGSYPLEDFQRTRDWMVGWGLMREDASFEDIVDTRVTAAR